EGIVDRRFATVGLSITQKPLVEVPALYSLGMGGLTRPLPRLLGRFGWTVEEVPFFFRVIRGASFVRNIRVLQTSQRRHLLFRALAASGVASLVALSWRVAACTVALRLRTRGLRLEEV